MTFTLAWITGPSRSGTTLLSRMIDAHPNCLGLWETWLYAAYYPDGFYRSQRTVTMRKHGLTNEEIETAARQSSVREGYAYLARVLAERYGKGRVTAVTDKVPYAHCEQDDMRELVDRSRSIYSIRHPLAMLASVKHNVKGQWRARDKRASPLYMQTILDNCVYWSSRLTRPNVLIVRYEDLVTQPDIEMKRVYAHLGVKHDDRSYERLDNIPHPERFEFRPNSMQALDASRIDAWKGTLSENEQREFLSHPGFQYILERFYGGDAGSKAQ